MIVVYKTNIRRAECKRTAVKYNRIPSKGKLPFRFMAIGEIKAFDLCICP
jgi:hypothetical protein